MRFQKTWTKTPGKPHRSIVCMYVILLLPGGKSDENSRYERERRKNHLLFNRRLCLRRIERGCFLSLCAKLLLLLLRIHFFVSGLCRCCRCRPFSSSSNVFWCAQLWGRGEKRTLLHLYMAPTLLSTFPFLTCLPLAVFTNYGAKERMGVCAVCSPFQKKIFFIQPQQRTIIIFFFFLLSRGFVLSPRTHARTHYWPVLPKRQLCFVSLGSRETASGQMASC